MEVEQQDDHKQLESVSPPPVTTHPSSGVETTDLLIDGFIREHIKSTQSQLTISTAIVELIRSFVQRMPGHNFTWTITTKLLNSILHAPPGFSLKHKGYESDIFEICPFVQTDNMPDIPGMAQALSVGLTSTAPNLWLQIKHNVRNLKFKFYLKLYPNGSCPDNQGQFELKLILISLPSILSKLRFHYQVHCHQLDAFWSSLVAFTMSREVATHSHTITDTGYGHGIDLNALRIQNEQKRLHSLTLSLTLDVIRVGINMGPPPSNHKRRSKTEAHVFYSYCPRYFFDVNDTANFGRKFMMKHSEMEFMWNVNDAMLAVLGTSKPGKSIISDVYHNMWSLSLHHSDHSNHRNNDAAESSTILIDHKATDSLSPPSGTITIGLQLAALPSNLASIVVQIKLQCLQTASCWSTIKKFNYQQFEYRQLFDTDFAVNELVSMFPSKMTICADIMVIEAFDEFGQEMSLVQQQKMDILNGRCPPPNATLMGTHGHIFVPMVRMSSKSKSSPNGARRQFHYQNICVSTSNRFEQKSPDELRFEDQYGTRAAPMAVDPFPGRNWTFGRGSGRRPTARYSGRLRGRGRGRGRRRSTQSNTPFAWTANTVPFAFCDQSPQSQQNAANGVNGPNTGNTVSATNAVNGVNGVNVLNAPSGNGFGTHEQSESGISGISGNDAVGDDTKGNGAEYTQSITESKGPWSQSPFGSDIGDKKEDQKAHPKEEEKKEDPKVQELMDRVEALTKQLSEMSQSADALRKHQRVSRRSHEEEDGKIASDDRAAGSKTDEEHLDSDTEDGGHDTVRNTARFKGLFGSMPGGQAKSFKWWVRNVLDFDQYYRLFVRNGVDDFRILCEVTDEQLEEMGVEKVGHRIRILQEIRKVRCKECGRTFAHGKGTHSLRS